MLTLKSAIVKQDLLLFDEIVIRQSLALFSTSLVLFEGALYLKNKVELFHPVSHYVSQNSNIFSLKGTVAREGFLALSSLPRIERADQKNC
jgi:hypothetical protein